MYLHLRVYFLLVEFVASETGQNKKQSTAICALSMVRQLFKANLIERQGEPIKHVTRGGLLGKKPIEPKPAPTEGNGTAAPSVNPTPGQKRKADEPVIENLSAFDVSNVVLHVVDWWQLGLKNKRPLRCLMVEANLINIDVIANTI